MFQRLLDECHSEVMYFAGFGMICVSRSKYTCLACLRIFANIKMFISQLFLTWLSCMYH